MTCELSYFVKDYILLIDYSLRLFLFSRFNGILGSFQTNSHEISIQVMRKFVTAVKLNAMDFGSNIPESTVTFRLRFL